jgi:hypothetical protein
MMQIIRRICEKSLVEIVSKKRDFENRSEKNICKKFLLKNGAFIRYLVRIKLEIRLELDFNMK